MIFLVILLAWYSSALAQPRWLTAPPPGFVVGAGQGPTQVAARRQALEEARHLLLEAGGSSNQREVSDTLRTTGPLSSVLDPELRRQAITFQRTQGDLRLQAVRWHERRQGSLWVAYVLVPQEGRLPIYLPRYDWAAAGLSLAVPGLGQLKNNHRRGWAFLVAETILISGGGFLYHLADEEDRQRTWDLPGYYRSHTYKAQLAWNLTRLLWAGAAGMHLWNVTDAWLSPADPWR